MEREDVGSWGVREDWEYYSILLRRELRDLQYKLFISILSRFCSIDHDFLSFGGNNFPICHFANDPGTTNGAQFLLAPAWLIGEELLCKKQQITGEEEMLVPLWINKDPRGNAPKRRKWIQFAV